MGLILPLFCLMIYILQNTYVDGSFGKALPLIVFGGLSVIAGLLSLILPETSGKLLPETIDDAVNFGKFVLKCFYTFNFILGLLYKNNTCPSRFCTHIRYMRIQSCPFMADIIVQD